MLCIRGIHTIADAVRLRSHLSHTLRKRRVLMVDWRCLQATLLRADSLLGYTRGVPNWSTHFEAAAMGLFDPPVGRIRLASIKRGA